MVENHIQKLIGTDLTFKMIFVEGDTFDMGNNDADAFGYEKDIHKVKLSNFYLAEFPATQEIWEFVMEKNPSYFVGAKGPVEQVSWNTIRNDFILALNDCLLNKVEGFEFCLPTEAQWEYAARGGKHGLKHNFKYAGSNKLKEVGWFNENSHGETKPVGLKTPNLLGLHDMSGNVWEWCNDWYDENYYKNSPLENPSGDVKGPARVLRGGSWLNSALRCRATFRHDGTPDLEGSHIGFRLALCRTASSVVSREQK